MDGKNAWNGVEPINPPENLFNQIINRIEAEKKLARIKRRVIFFVSLAVVSTGAFGSLLILFNKEIFQSDFAAFLNLFFYNPSSVLLNWKEFFLSLLESFPIEYVLVPLVFLFITLKALIFIKRSKESMDSIYKLLKS